MQPLLLGLTCKRLANLPTNITDSAIPSTTRELTLTYTDYTID